MLYFDKMFTLSNIILVLIGLLMATRTWCYFNFLLLNEKKQSVNLFKYLNLDNNLIINYFKVQPIFIKPSDPELIQMKIIVNSLTYSIYVLIVIFAFNLITA